MRAGREREEQEAGWSDEETNRELDLVVSRHISATAQTPFATVIQFTHPASVEVHVLVHGVKRETGALSLFAVRVDLVKDFLPFHGCFSILSIEKITNELCCIYDAKKYFCDFVCSCDFELTYSSFLF